MIGLFDSGFGGLTVLRSVINKLPQYEYIYLGDNARTPYGNKSASVIYEYTKQAVAFLFKQGCVLVVLACNTASAKALRRIQREYLPKYYPHKKVLGVIIPVCEAASKESRYKRIGVIATRATINSGIYEKELYKLRTELKIYSRACPLLVPLIEENWLDKPETSMILKRYLYPLKQKHLDALILGCTHYPFLIKEIKHIMGKKCHVLDTNKVIADKLRDYLERNQEIEKKISRKEKMHFYTTDDPEWFIGLGKKYYGRRINVAEKANLK